MGIELVKVSGNDARLIFDSWGYNPENFRYLSTAPQKNVADARQYLDRALLYGNDLVFHIKHSESKRIVGLIKAKIEGHRALVGFVIDQPFWGQGVATRAVMQFIPLLKRDPAISRIWATCAINNIGSSRVLEKCGFLREGILKNWIIYPVQGCDAHDNFSYYLDDNNC